MKKKNETTFGKLNKGDKFYNFKQVYTKVSDKTAINLNTKIPVTMEEGRNVIKAT